MFVFYERASPLSWKKFGRIINPISRATAGKVKCKFYYGGIQQLHGPLIEQKWAIYILDAIGSSQIFFPTQNLESPY